MNDTFVSVFVGVVIGIFGALSLLSLYLLYRSEKVYKEICRYIDMVHEYNKQMISEGRYGDTLTYECPVPYNRMLHSFKDVRAFLPQSILVIRGPIQ